MNSYAELIIALSRQQDGTYWVRLSFDRPDDQDLRTPESGAAHFDFVALRQAGQDPQAYGALLKDSLFGDEASANVREFMKQCLAVTQEAGQRVRIRLLIDRSAPKLHDLRWETLSSLEGNEFLAVYKQHLLSRFLYSTDWRRTELRPKKALRVLVVIANPGKLKDGVKLPGGRELAEIDVKGELARAQNGLKGLQIDELTSSAEGPVRVTLEKLEQKLEEGFDFLYLVCHGALFAVDADDPASPRQALLWLESQDGTIDRVPGQELARVIGHLPPEKQPRMVVLASCQSGGKGQVPGEEQSKDQGAAGGWTGRSRDGRGQDECKRSS